MRIKRIYRIVIINYYIYKVDKYIKILTIL